MKIFFYALCTMLCALPAAAEEDGQSVPAPAPAKVVEFSVGEESDELPPAQDDREQAPPIPDSSADNQPPAKVVTPDSRPMTEEEKKKFEEEAAKRWLPRKNAVIQILDKTKVRNISIKSEVGKESNSGPIQYVVKKCFVAAEQYPPEDAALIEIVELQSDKSKRKLFYGWMFSGAPALTYIEHPIYDVVLTSCVD